MRAISSYLLRRGRLGGSLALALAGSSGCAGGQAPPKASAPRIVRVLFIGNSLTYVNDLPRTLAGIARAGGDSIEVLTVAGPNLALIDHLDGRRAATDAIGSRRWDIVVLQQGPTTRPIHRDTLVLATRRLNQLIRRAGARTAVLMVWPSANRLTAFDSVRASCQYAASAVGGMCVPAGAAWFAALTGEDPLPVYGADGFHPSELGTYLAALVLYEVVTGKDARALPARASVARGPLDLDENAARRLQRIAHETLERHPTGR